MNHTPEDGQPDQSFWGINPKDKIWFITITGAAGAAWSIAIAVTAVINRTAEKTISAVIDPANTDRVSAAISYTNEETITGLLTGIATGTAGAFAAAGFGTWLILNIKDAVMSIADAIRKRTAQNVEAIKEETRNQTIQTFITQAETHSNPDAKEIVMEIADKIEKKDHSG